MGKGSKHKKKKDRPIYIDDGSTVADMSGVGRKPGAQGKAGNAFLMNQPRKKAHKEPRTRAGQIWETYVAAVKMMVKPMLITIGIVCAVFLIVWILFGFL